MYWSVLSTRTSFHIIETSWVHAHQFTALNCFEYRFLTSLNWILLCTCTSLHWIIFLNTYGMLHCTEASSNHVPHFALLTFFENVLYLTISNLLKYMYLTSLLKYIEYMYVSSLNWIFLSTCISLHWNEGYWVHIRCFTELKLLEVVHLTSLNWSFFSTCTSLQCIEAFWKNFPQYNVLKLLEYMYLI